MNPFWRALMFSSLAVGRLLLAGPPQVVEPTKEGTVVEQRTWPLSAQAKIRVRSDVGKVHLTGWDKKEVELVATFKSGPRGEHVRLEAEAEEGALTLRTATPKSRSWFSFGGSHSASCGLELRVPREAILYVRSDVGTISVEGCQGWLDLGSDVGTITVTGLEGHACGMNLQTDVGKIRVDLRGAKGEIDARTDVGHISATVPGLTIQRQESNRLQATLNGGKAPIRIRTDVGGITLQ